MSLTLPQKKPSNNSFAQHILQAWRFRHACHFFKTRDRFLWAARGDLRKLRLAGLCQFTLAGPPYYGTECKVQADGRAQRIVFWIAAILRFV